MSEHRNSKRSNAQALSRRIGEITQDGEEMMRVMVAIMRDDQAPVPDRRGAVEWLTDRWAGKAPIVIEHDVVSSLPLLDVSACTVDELRALERTLAKMLPEGTPPIIDAHAVEYEDDDPDDEGGSSAPAVLG